MATVLAETCTPDSVFSFSITPGTLLQFLTALDESGPRLKCLEGSVTLVSPGRSHETTGARLEKLVFAVCQELEIEYTELESTTWTLPKGGRDTAYEADKCYYIQSHETATEGQVPDLAIEIVVSNPETKALACGAVLEIPEMWVFDVPCHRLTFYHLSRRGKHKGTYQPKSASRAFPFLVASEVLERLEDPDKGAVAFHRNCREWARRVLVPRCKPRGK
jgi:Uma2 family endonuclease